jgi:hypothetical protein
MNITHNQSSVEPFFLDCRGLVRFLLLFAVSDWLPIYDWTTYIVLRRIHRKHHFLYCCIYSALHRNGIYPIVACVSFVAGMCLRSLCPAAGLHAKMLYMRSFLCYSDHTDMSPSIITMTVSLQKPISTLT